MLSDIKMQFQLQTIHCGVPNLNHMYKYHIYHRGKPIISTTLTIPWNWSKPALFHLQFDCDKFMVSTFFILAENWSRNHKGWRKCNNFLVYLSFSPFSLSLSFVILSLPLFYMILSVFVSLLVLEKMWSEKNKICRVIKCDTERNKKREKINSTNKQDRLKDCRTEVLVKKVAS